MYCTGTLVDGAPDPDAHEHPFARAVVGTFLLSVAGLGLLHLARDAPALDAGRGTRWPTPRGTSAR